MDKDELKLFRKQAFLRRLEEALEDKPAAAPKSAMPGSPLNQFGAQVPGPVAAGNAAKDLKWDLASRGVAGTGTPISMLKGAAKQYATEAHIGGGTKENGGGGREAAAAVLSKAGWSAAGVSIAAWSALIVCEVAMQVGPPVATAVWRTRGDVKAAIRAEQESGED